MAYAAYDAVGAALLGTALAAAAVVDVRTRTVPRAFVGAVVAVQCAFLVSTCGNLPSFFRSTADPLVSGAAVLLVLSGAGLILALRAAGTADAGIGGGDVKLLSALGFSMGFNGVLICLFAACLAALAYCLLRGRGAGEAFPFVPFIALGFAVAVAWGWGSSP